MTWPTAATKVNLDSAADDPKQARGDLAALVDKFNQVQAQLTGIYILAETRAAIAAATIATDVNAIETSGYTTAGDGGAARYMRVGSDPAHNLKVQSSDGAWWEIVPANNVITFQACGGIQSTNPADGAANVTAFNDFIGYAQDKFQDGITADGPTLQFPKGDYHFNDHLNVKAAVRIQGAGTSSEGTRTATVMHFVANSNGIIVQNADTIDETTASSTFTGTN